MTNVISIQRFNKLRSYKSEKPLEVSYSNNTYNIAYKGHTTPYSSYIDAKAHIDAIMCSMQLQEA